MNLEPINARLAAFAQSVGDEPPAAVLKRDGSPSAELMDFRNRHGLSLDWMITGDGPKYRGLPLQEAIPASYQVLNLLRVCARALDGDTPALPGDDAAAAQAIEIAAERMGPIIDALEAALAAKEQAKCGKNTHAELVNQYLAARDAWVAEGEDADLQPEGPNFDEMERLIKESSNTPPRSIPEAVSMIELIFSLMVDGFDFDGSPILGTLKSGLKGMAQ